LTYFSSKTRFSKERNNKKKARSRFLTTSASDGSKMTHSFKRYWFVEVRLPKLIQRKKKRKKNVSKRYVI